MYESRSRYESSLKEMVRCTTFDIQKVLDCVFFYRRLTHDGNLSKETRAAIHQDCLIVLESSWKPKTSVLGPILHNSPAVEDTSYNSLWALTAISLSLCDFTRWLSWHSSIHWWTSESVKQRSRALQTPLTTFMLRQLERCIRSGQLWSGVKMSGDAATCRTTCVADWIPKTMLMPAEAFDSLRYSCCQLEKSSRVFSLWGPQ